MAEVERRNLALQAGYPSLYKYAHHVLELTDKMALDRANAARLAVIMPETIGKLARGELTRATCNELWNALKEAETAMKAPAKRAEARKESLKLAPELPLERHVSENPVKPKPIALEEKRELLEQVSGKTRRESEAILQGWKHERAGIEPPEAKCELRLELTPNQLEAFDRLRDLLSHKLGGRSPEAAFVWMLEQGLEKVDPVRIERRAAARRARKDAGTSEALSDVEVESSLVEPFENSEPSEAEFASAREHIPADVERRVWIRGDGRCQYPRSDGTGVCGSTAFLDFDHVIPLEDGGSNDESNLRLCRASHNRRRRQWQVRETELCA